MQRNDIKPRPYGARARHGLFALKVRGFLMRPAAEATQNDLSVIRRQLWGVHCWFDFLTIPFIAGILELVLSRFKP